jgi:hypothetical protein
MGFYRGPNIVTDNLTFAIDVGSARSYTGSGTTVNDLVGTNNVTLANGVLFASNNGGVLIYDGVDDQGTAGDFFNYQAFTINLWVNPGSTQAQYANIIDNDHNGNRNWTLQQSSTSQNLYSFNVFGASYQNSVTGDFQLTAGDWVNLTFTYDGTRVRGYRDGVLFATGAALGVPINYSAQDFHIARWGGNTSRDWEGQFGPLYCYNAALNAAQILQNFNAQKSRFGL